MSVPDEQLRRMLTECGVEWRETAFGETIWLSTVLDGRVSARRVNDKLVLFTGYKLITPEQAIAATLGTGTCRRVLYKPTGVLVCSECGAGIPKQLDKYCFLHYCPNCGRKVVGE